MTSLESTDAATGDNAIISRPKVTVLTPTYNRPDYLPDAIRSVLAQELGDWEMLVINDGGADVGEIVAQFDDPRIRYFNREVNRGKAACLNFGLERAGGRYVAYLDDDDLWYPNHLALLARVLDEHPDAGVAYSDLYRVICVVDAAGRRYPLQKSVDVCRDYNRLFMFHFNHTLHVSLMHRKELIDRAGGYNPDVRVLIDWDLTRKLSFYTDFIHVEAATGEYYLPISGSDRISDVQRRDEPKYKQNLRRIRAGLPPEPWPMVEKVAVVLPVCSWGEATPDLLLHLADNIDYPARFVLVNMGVEPPLLPEEIAELPNFALAQAPPGADLDTAYRHGARHVAADYLYLPTPACSRNADMRILKALCYMGETGCRGVRWPQDPGDTDYDVFLSADALANGLPPWPEAEMIPEQWVAPHVAADTLVTLAQECEQQGDYRTAGRQLQHAAQVEPGGVGGAFLSRRFADVAFASGDYDEAEARCREMIARGYGAENWVRLGRIHQGRGDWAPAAEAYRRALAGLGLRPEHLDAEVFPLATPVIYDAFRAMAGLGECLVELGRFDEASTWLARAARLQVRSARPQLAFGRLFLAQGRLPEAEEALRIAMERNPGQDPSEACALMAAVLERRRMPGQGLEFCLKALQKNPGNPQYLQLCARLARAAGREHDLEDIYRAFLEHRPGHVEALVALAELLVEQGDGEQARRLAEQALLLDPGNRRATGVLEAA